MIKVKEHTKESLLKSKLKKLEKQLLQTQKELQREAEYNNHLEGIIKESSAKKSKTINIKSATKIEFAQVNDIVCCNADEGYTRNTVCKHPFAESKIYYVKISIAHLLEWRIMGNGIERRYESCHNGLRK